LLIDSIMNSVDLWDVDKELEGPDLHLNDEDFRMLEEEDTRDGSGRHGEGEAEGEEGLQLFDFEYLTFVKKLHIRTVQSNLR